MSSQALDIMEKLRQVDSLIQNKWEKLRDINAQREEIKAKICQKDRSIANLRSKLKEDQALEDQIKVEIQIQEEVEIPARKACILMREQELAELKSKIETSNKELDSLKNARFQNMFVQEPKTGQNLKEAMAKELASIRDKIKSLEDKDIRINNNHKQICEQREALDKAEMFRHCLTEKVREYKEAADDYSDKLRHISIQRDQLKTDPSSSDPELLELEARLEKLEKMKREKELASLKKIGFQDSINFQANAAGHNPQAVPFRGGGEFNATSYVPDMPPISECGLANSHSELRSSAAVSQIATNYASTIFQNSSPRPTSFGFNPDIVVPDSTQALQIPKFKFRKSM